MTLVRFRAALIAASAALLAIPAIELDVALIFAAAFTSRFMVNSPP